MSGYNVFSYFYDDLTFNVDYEKRVEYILRCFARLDHEFGLGLDLACGTGTITRILDKMGKNIFGLDGSTDMLSIAYNKALENGQNILYVNQNMQDFTLPYNVDTVICTLDAINHMTEISDVKKTFQNVYKFLNDGGVFLFDVNTIYKHDKVLCNNTFYYDVDSVSLVWKNKLRENHIVDIDLQFTYNDNETANESFSERAYDIDLLKDILKEIGFKIEKVYTDMTFLDLDDEAEKATIIVRK